MLLVFLLYKKIMDNKIKLSVDDQVKDIRLRDATLAVLDRMPLNNSITI